MTVRTGTFDTAEQVSLDLPLAVGATATVILTNSGGHDWQVNLEELVQGRGATALRRTFTTDTTGTTFTNPGTKPITLRVRCVLLDVADTVAYILNNTPSTTAAGVVEVVASAASAKAGTTAGFVVGAGNNLGKIATLPKAITAGTLVIGAPSLRVGDRIVGAYLVGSLQAASTKHTTVLLDLRSLTAAAAGATDASVAVMAAALDVQANTILSSANTYLPALDHAVVAGETLYGLVTATTANDDLCTAEIQGLVLQVIPA